MKRRAEASEAEKLGRKQIRTNQNQKGVLPEGLEPLEGDWMVSKGKERSSEGRGRVIVG